MIRKFSEPDKRKRKRAPVLAMIAEGDNETEKRYFNWFKKAFKNRLPYRIDFLNTRNGTEPEQMLNNAIQRYKEKELNKEDGDRLIIFVDLDCKEEKYQAIMRLAKKAKQHNIIFCYSNPCFEIWYLDHYRKTSREYENSDKAVKEVNYSATSNRASRRLMPSFFFPVFPACQEYFRISQSPMRRDAFCCSCSARSCIIRTVVSG